MSSHAASFVKFTIKAGKMSEMVDELKGVIPEYISLPGVLSMTFAQTGPNEIRSLVVYETMQALETNGPTLSAKLKGIMHLLEENEFERAVGEVVADSETRAACACTLM